MTNKQFDKDLRQLAQAESFVANDRSIASLERSIQAALRADPRAVKEEPVMKRKISFVLVCVLTLMLLAGGVALAIVSFRDTARQIVETEQQDGTYATWPVEKKIALAKAIVAQGYVEETQAVEALLADSLPMKEAGQAADEILVAFTGLEVSEVSFREIMEAAWGPFPQWSAEEQAWYSALMVEMGLQGGDHTLYVQPEGPVDEAQAIAIARREIAMAYSVDESALDAYPVTTAFQVPEFAGTDDDQPYWQVEYHAPEDMPQALRLFPTSFWLFIHPETGALLESADTLRDGFQELMDRAFEIDLTMQVADSFAENRTSVEGMMAFRQTWEPQLDVLIAAGQLPESEAYRPHHLKNKAQLIPRIGLPQAGDIGAEEALENARQCIAALPGWPGGQRDYLVPAVQVYLLPESSSEASVYHFIFSLPRITGSMNAAKEDAFFQRRDAYDTAFGGKDHAPNHIYIRIDASTGQQIGEPQVLYEWLVDYEDLLVQ